MVKSVKCAVSCKRIRQILKGFNQQELLVIVAEATKLAIALRAETLCVPLQANPRAA